jgi:hypothetical protein
MYISGQLIHSPNHTPSILTHLIREKSHFGEIGVVSMVIILTFTLFGVRFLQYMLLQEVSLEQYVISAVHISILTLDRRKRFVMFEFPVCLNCFTNSNTIDFAGASHSDRLALITVGCFK